MTVAAQDPINQFIITGGETTGPWTWQLNADADLTVFKQLASTGEILTLTLDTDYSVNSAGLGDKAGGTITFLAPQLPAVVGDVWTLQRDTVLKRSKDFATSGDFLAVTVNPQFDDPILMNQDSKRDADRAVRKNPGIADELNPLIPQPVSGRALKLAESTPGNFTIVMSETDPDDGSVKTVAGMFATVLNTPSNIVVQESQDGFEIRVNTSSGNVDITLPDSTSLSADFRVAITKSSSDSNDINVKVQGTDTVNGVTSDTVQSTQFLRLLYVLDQSTGAYIFAIDQVGIQSVVQDTSPQYGAAMDSNGFPLNTSRSTVTGDAVASDIWDAVVGNEIDFTGTPVVTDFPDAPRPGASRILHCAGAVVFTNNSNLFVPGAANYTASAGDVVSVHAITVSTFRLTILKANGRSVVSGFDSQLFHVVDEKTSTSSAGTFTSASFQVRVLQTIKTNEIAGASITTNTITLPVGVYFIEASAPAFQVDAHSTRFESTSGISISLVGTRERATGNQQTRSFITGRFTVAASQTFQIQHRCQTTRPGDGLGEGSVNLGSVNIFAVFKIWKIG